MLNQTFWALAVLVGWGVVVGAWVCNDKKGPDEPLGVNSSHFPYARCYSHLTPGHFTEAEADNRQAIVSTEYRWPLGKIPYVLEDSLSDDDEQNLMDGMELVEASTCLRFMRRNGEENYVTIRTNDKWGGCFSGGIGMRGGEQVINLNTYDCRKPSTAAHELLHAAGLYHEHTRADRDDYITVDWNNICEEVDNNYKRCDKRYGPNESCVSYGFAYNVKSIMHYTGFVSDRNFAVDTNKPIMISKDPNNPIPNTQNSKITAEDAGKINYMYNDCRGDPR